MEKNVNEKAIDDLSLNLTLVAEATFGLALEKGWGGNSDLEDIALIHSEVSEMAEACRIDPPRSSKKISGYTEAEEEAADVFIRLINFCIERNLRLGEAVRAKHEYNKNRPYKHGGKKI